MNDAYFLKGIQGLILDNTLFTKMNTASSNTLFPDSLFSTTDLQEKALEYFFHSGDKRLSKFAHYLLINAVDLNAFLAAIVTAVMSRFSSNWKAVQDAYFLTAYSPLENYDMEEQRKPNLNEKVTSKTDFKSHNETKTSVYGFNSTTPVEASEASSDTSGAQADNQTSIEKKNTGSETLTRHGNIGVTTSQQMLQSEIDLRKFDFWEMVFRDIDRLICQQVY